MMKEIIKEDQKRWLYDQIYRLKLKEREIMLMSLTLHMSDEQKFDERFQIDNEEFKTD